MENAVRAALLSGLMLLQLPGLARAGDRLQLAASYGDCNADPGVALVAVSAQGYPPLPAHELVPPSNWVPFMHPTVPALAFYHPPGWQPTPYAQIGATGVRVVAPDNRAGFEIFNTTGVGGITGAQQVAEQGLRSLIGANTPADVVCAFDYPVPGPVPTSGFFEAVATQTSLAAAVGMVFHDPASGAPIAIDHRAIIGPRDQFAGLVRSVFLPVFTQMLGANAGASEGGDDGDGGDAQKTKDAIKKAEETIKGAEEAVKDGD